MLTTRDFESGPNRIQNRVIRIHSGVCSSDDDVECMHRTADAYSRIGACYIHWNCRAGIAMKFDHSGIALNWVLDSNESNQRSCRDWAIYQKDDTGRFVGEQWLNHIEPKTNSHDLYHRPRGPPPPNCYIRSSPNMQQSTANQRVQNGAAIRRRLALSQWAVESSCCDCIPYIQCNEWVHNWYDQCFQITGRRLNCSLRECETTTYCCAIRYPLIGSRLKGMSEIAAVWMVVAVLVVVG